MEDVDRRQKFFFSLLTITLSFLGIQFWESPSHLGHVHTIADGYGVNVVVNFLSQVFFFPLFLDMVMCANEFETKEKQKLPEIN